MTLLMSKYFDISSKYFDMSKVIFTYLIFIIMSSILEYINKC